jgi:NAD(P)-dependent dehydrogenase (short-subunit alcohol dehydrogenase family)
MGAYLASKSVVMRLTESLSEEVKGHGINVNAVLPSVINTARNRQEMPDADFSLWVDPEDLGQVVCFLGSDAAKAIHGALIPVNGLT